MGGAGMIQISSFAKMSAMSAKQNTGPSLHTNFGPYWQCPQRPKPQFMFRSRLT